MDCDLSNILEHRTRWDCVEIYPHFVQLTIKFNYSNFPVNHSISQSNLTTLLSPLHANWTDWGIRQSRKIVAGWAREYCNFTTRLQYEAQLSQFTLCVLQNPKLPLPLPNYLIVHHWNGLLSITTVAWPGNNSRRISRVGQIKIFYLDCHISVISLAKAATS